MTSSINMMGTYSGITMDTIDQLIEAESAKGVQYTNQKTAIENEQNAWKDVNTRLDNLNKALETLANPETFRTRTVASNLAESSALSVTADTAAAEGQYRVSVQQLATATTLTGAKITSVDGIDEALNVEGSFTFNVDNDGATEEKTIQIAATDTLEDVVTKINEHSNASGVQATIIDQHLVLTNTELGAGEINLTADAGLSTALGLDTGTELTGQSAMFTVNGIEITRDSNNVDDAVQGLTFELTNVHQGAESEVITVKTDADKATEAVQAFVDQYNSTMSFIDDQLDVGDPTLEDNATGALTGDSALMRLQSSLRSMITRNISGNFSGEFDNIEDLGITVDRYGEATLDQATFKDALAQDPANVARFFFTDQTSQAVTNEASEVIEESVEYDGFSELMNNFIDSYISESTGIIATKNETYSNAIEDLNEQIDVFNERLEAKRERYIAEFTALDVAMMQAQSQLDYLYSQLGMGSE